jgi:hypothetical protein
MPQPASRANQQLTGATPALSFLICLWHSAGVFAPAPHTPVALRSAATGLSSVLHVDVGGILYRRCFNS